MDGQQEVPNNPTDSPEPVTEETASAPAEKVESTETEQKGTTSETGKAEFKDPNMQAKFTQKMQELSEEKKTMGAKQQKAEAFDALMADEDVSKYVRTWYDKKTGKVKEEVGPISDEEYDRAITDRNAFQEIIDKRVKAIAGAEYGDKVSQLENRLTKREFEQDIDDFSNAKDSSGNLLHGDFWELDKSGKLEPYLRALQNSGMHGLQRVEAAYKLAKYPNLKNEAMKEAHTVVEKKKAAIGEKGGKVDAGANTKKLSMVDFARRKAKELNIEVP